MFLSLFKGVDRWVFGVDDADTIAVHALAICGPEAAQTMARKLESLVKPAGKPSSIPGLSGIMAAASGCSTLLANLRVGHGKGSVELQTEGFGTLAELGACRGRGRREAAPNQDRNARTK